MTSFRIKFTLPFAKTKPDIPQIKKELKKSLQDQGYKVMSIEIEDFNVYQGYTELEPYYQGSFTLFVKLRGNVDIKEGRYKYDNGHIVPISGVVTSVVIIIAATIALLFTLKYTIADIYDVVQKSAGIFEYISPSLIGVTLAFTLLLWVWKKKN